MNSSFIISWMIIIGIIVLCGIVFSKPIKMIGKVLLQGGIGIGALWIVNLFATPLGWHVGINLITALVIGILGVPGFLLLYVLQGVI